MSTMRMRKRNKLAVAGGWLLAPLLAGCSVTQPALRERLVGNLGPIVKLEERAKEMSQNVEMLALLGKIERHDAQALKENYDVYYVHHEAAAVYLAQGRLEAYRSHVELAEKELDAMELRLKGLIPSSAEEPRAEKPGGSVVEL